MRQAVVVYVAAIALTAALGARIIKRGGPYFDFPPSTIVEHSLDANDPVRKSLTLFPIVAQVIPRGESVAMIDDACFYVGTGQLPRHEVLPPFFAKNDCPPDARAKWAIAINEPFASDHYELVASYAEGRLYKLKS